MKKSFGFKENIFPYFVCVLLFDIQHFTIERIDKAESSTQYYSRIFINILFFMILSYLVNKSGKDRQKNNKEKCANIYDYHLKFWKI